jgi:hypothetical protein
VSGREHIMQALFTLLTAGNAYPTAGRRLVLWTKVAEQPALFLRHVGDTYPTRPTGIPAKVQMDCEAWIYSRAGGNPAVIPETALNSLLDGVETALKPDPAAAQTLGGLVQHCWIEGRVEIHPGDLDGQAIAVVPIRLLVPALV